MKSLQAASAAIEMGAGVALLCCPSFSAELLIGVPLGSAAALTVTRIGGAGLLTLGVACLLAYGDTQSRAARGMVAAMWFYNVAAACIIAYARFGYGLLGGVLWLAVVLHAAMAVWCTTCLWNSLSRASLETDEQMP